MLPDSNPCNFDLSANCNDIAMWADQIIAEKFCDHVRAAELVHKDGVMYAVFDSPCREESSGIVRCGKKGSGRLQLIALRRNTASARALRVYVVVEFTPADSFRVQDAKYIQGAARLELGAFVLPPAYKAVKCWRHSVPLDLILAEQTVASSIDIQLKVKREGRAATPSLGLSTTVPCCRKEVVDVTTDFMTIVLAESVKLLLKDGWEFLKGQLPGSFGSGDLIQLHLGEAVIQPNQSSDEDLTTAIKLAKVTVSNGDLGELSGLNSRLSNLLIEKRALMERVDRGATAVDSAKVAAELTRTERDISRVQEEIWALLQRTGQAAVVRSGGPS